jgi:tRNA A37 threonylcarbamoyladenosine modification protein TsaB
VPIHIAYDAGRDEVFAAVATPDPGSPSGWSVGAGTIAVGAEWAKSLPAGAIIAGPAVASLSDALSGRPDLVVASAAASLPTAVEAAAIALVRAAAGESHEPAAVVPEYMRQTYADETAGRAAH